MVVVKLQRAKVKKLASWVVPSDSLFPALSPDEYREQIANEPVYAPPEGVTPDDRKKAMKDLKKRRIQDWEVRSLPWFKARQNAAQEARRNAHIEKMVKRYAQEEAKLQKTFGSHYVRGGPIPEQQCAGWVKTSGNRTVWATWIEPYTTPSSPGWHQHKQLWAVVVEQTPDPGEDYAPTTYYALILEGDALRLINEERKRLTEQPDEGEGEDEGEDEGEGEGEDEGSLAGQGLQIPQAGGSAVDIAAGMVGWAQ